VNPASLLGLAVLVAPAAGDGATSDFDPGPAVGARLPTLGLADQNGRTRTFRDLSGPEGLLLLVYRSADW